MRNFRVQITMIQQPGTFNFEKLFEGYTDIKSSSLSSLPPRLTKRSPNYTVLQSYIFDPIPE